VCVSLFDCVLLSDSPGPEYAAAVSCSIKCLMPCLLGQRESPKFDFYRGACVCVCVCMCAAYINRNG